MKTSNRLIVGISGASGAVLGVRMLQVLKPLDVEAVYTAARETAAIFTIEEHSILGGLGGAVAEALMESDQRPLYFKRIGLNDTFSSLVGDQDYLRGEYGLNTAGILNTIQSVLGQPLNGGACRSKVSSSIRHLGRNGL